MLSGARADRRADRGRGRRRCREPLGGGPRRTPSPRSSTSCATAARRSSCRSPGAARPDPAELAERFAAEHEARYGYRDPDGEVELVDIRLALVVARAASRSPAAAPAGGLERRRAPGALRRRVARGRGPARRARRPASRPTGPCVFELPEATLVAPAGLAAPRSTRPGRSSRRGAASDERSGLDPITLQVLVGALRAACDEMGAVLIRSAYSAEHQGAPRLLDGALRRRRRAGDAGRAHPGPPRLDARRGRRGARRGAAARRRSGSSTTPTAAAPTCPTSP